MKLRVHMRSERSNVRGPALNEGAAGTAVPVTVGVALDTALEQTFGATAGVAEMSALTCDPRGDSFAHFSCRCVSTQIRRARA
jgi:hypothetical protein